MILFYNANFSFSRIDRFFFFKRKVFDFEEGFVSYGDFLFDALMLCYYARLSSRRDPVLESEFLVFAE